RQRSTEKPPPAEEKEERKTPKIPKVLAVAKKVKREQRSVEPESRTDVDESKEPNNNSVHDNRSAKSRQSNRGRAAAAAAKLAESDVSSVKNDKASSRQNYSLPPTPKKQIVKRPARQIYSPAQEESSVRKSPNSPMENDEKEEAMANVVKNLLQDD
ncbi:hypothetical protein PFISCL1PPCAC_25816, partial [Pristionchus fissidentatus]